MLGPFPDEPLTIGLDRLLYYGGAQRMQRLLNLSKPTDECDECNNCEIQVECPKGKVPTCSPPNDKSKTPTSTCKVCSKSVVDPKCSNRSGQRKARVDFADGANTVKQNPTGPTIGVRLKRSFSLCSLACRRLKTRFIPSSRSGACRGGGSNAGNGAGGVGFDDATIGTGVGGGKCNAPKWLWTRLIRQSNGCKIYEVYKDSDGKTNPNSLDRQKGATIIFVVMPNGYIMPFESLNFH